MLIRGYTNTRTGMQDTVRIDGMDYHHLLPIDPTHAYFRSYHKFNWGMEGGGAIELAFALLLHFCGTIDAWNYHGEFRDEIIAKVPRMCFFFESEDIQNYVKWKKSQHRLFTRLYWKLTARWIFSDLFYEFYYENLKKSPPYRKLM